MAIFNPDLLKAGDVQHLAALSFPRPVLLDGATRLDGSRLAAELADGRIHVWDRVAATPAQAAIDP